MRVLTVLIATVILFACATTGLTPADVSTPETWGAAKNVTTLRHLSFSEQPDAETLKIARQRGITTVISLRGVDELDWDEREAAERHGLQFIQIPIRKRSDTFSPAAMEAISAAVSNQQGEPILIHCSSGNRAAAWLATNLVVDHHMDVEASLAVARKVGLTRSSLEDRVRTYVHKQSD